jgi:hypothetical protein
VMRSLIIVAVMWSGFAFFLLAICGLAELWSRLSRWWCDPLERQARLPAAPDRDMPGWLEYLADHRDLESLETVEPERTWS